MRVGALGSLLKPTPDESRPLKPRREGLWRSFLQFPHTETSPYLQNAAKRAVLSGLSMSGGGHGLAGWGGGIRTSASESSPIGPTAIVRREEWQQIVRRTPAARQQ
jgi:hypothetical protein